MAKRYRVVKRHNGLHVLDRETGSAEHISATLAGLLDHTKVEPLLPRVVLYVDPVPLKESVERGLAVHCSWRGRPRVARQAEMPLTTKTLGKGRFKRKRGR